MRRISSFVFILFALVFVGSVVLWVRSGRHSDVLAVRSPRGHLNGAASDRGGVMIFLSDVPFAGVSGPDTGFDPDAARSVLFLSTTADEFKDIHDTLYDTVAKKWQLLGFRSAAGQVALTAQLTPNYHALIVPYWFLTAVTILPLARRVQNFWQRVRRKRQGLCLACGYDIRASDGRCPECGETIAGSRVRSTQTAA